MCDYERIEDHGAYSDILERLELMTCRALGLAKISDHVDIDQKIAWVECDHNGVRIHWDAEVDNDWLDPSIIVNYDGLLVQSSSPHRIYSNHLDFGQSALFAAFTPEQYQCFRKLSKVSLILTADQA